MEPRHHRANDADVQWAKEATTSELERWAKLGQVGFKKVAAESELDRRRWWREFWTRGIVAWIALILSGISLSVAIFK